MAFLKKPLKWTAVGQEPSELKKSEGFKMDESPAPGHFDFMFRSTYEAIEELQQKAGEVKTINNTLPNTAGNISVTKSTVGLGNVDNTSDANKPISNATKTELDKKYAKPTTGIPELDLDSAVKAALGKARTALQSVTKADVGLSNVDNTSDANKPISNATKAELDKKYVKPTSGIPKTDLSSDVQTALVKAESALQSVTKADIGLGNVDNTSDANKPISTAQQAALNLKANIASPTFTGTPKSTTAAAGTNTTQIATTAFVKTAVDNSVTTINDSIATHKADNTHIFNVDVTYATNVYTVVNAPSFTDYLTVRFKAPNTIVDTATFKIGTDVYTMVNADFELNEIVIVTFDKVQKKVFFKRGGGENQTLPPQLSSFTANHTGLSGQLKLDWTISSTTYLNDFLFVYKTGSYPTSSRDGTQVTAVKTARTLTISGLVNGTTYYVRAYPRNAKKQLQTDYKVANGSPIIADDVKMSPGPTVLSKGTMQEGYFGLVSSSELITGDTLASLVGLTAGTSQFSTTNWLKFAYKGKVLFVAQKPIRYSLSWDSINAIGAVTGTKQVAIKSLNYKVRLAEGALTNPSENNATDRGAKGSEWNRLMLAVHEQVKNKNWAYPAYVESDIQDFGTYFTDADLITNRSFGNGSYSWCQETTKSDSSGRVIRGDPGVSISIWFASSNANTGYGWRPVLELI